MFELDILLLLTHILLARGRWLEHRTGGPQAGVFHLLEREALLRQASPNRTVRTSTACLYSTEPESVIPCRRNYILQSDLEAFLSPRRAAEAFEMLDRDGDNQVTLAELRKSINEILK